MRDQAESLRLRLNKLKNKSETKAIAVLSGKGGVGKSNFSLNFALSLSSRGYNVLLFDMDIGMGNIDILMGLTPQHTIIDIFTQDLSIRDIIKKGPGNLSYVAGGTGLANMFTMDDQKFYYFIEQLQALLEDYEYLIFDMGAGISSDSIKFLMAMHEIFIITTPEPTSITDAYAAMKYIYVMENQIPFYLLVNRAHTEKEGNATLRRLSNAMNQFLQKDTTQLGILPEDRAVSKAVFHQTPFVLYDSKSNVSRAIEEVTKRYLDESFERSCDSGSFSFISKLRQFFLER